MSESYDVVLKSDGSDRPLNELGLVFYHGDLVGRQGEVLKESAWQEFREHPLPPRRSSGTLTIHQRDPTQDLVMAQQSFHGGTTHRFLEDATANHFASADGVDTRFENVLSLGVDIPATFPAITIPANEATRRWVGAVVVHSEDGDTAYAATGRSVHRCTRASDGTYTWVDVTPTATWADNTEIVALIEFGGAAYAFRNVPDPDRAVFYPLRFTPGAATEAEILTSYPADTDFYPTTLVKARNNSGAWALWGARGNEVRWSTDLTAGWMPNPSFVVGDSSQSITGLHPFRDTFLASKTNGLWQWDAAASTFVNITSEWEHAPGLETGVVGAEWHRDLFLTGPSNSFFRYNTETLELLTELVASVRFPGSGGRVTAMLPLPNDLLIALKPEKGDAVIARLRVVDGLWALHPVGSVNTKVEVHQMVMLDEEALWVLGETTADRVSAAMWREPSEAAAFQSSSYASQGQLVTSPWHGGVPDVDKSCLVLSTWTDGVDKDHPIRVHIRTDSTREEDWKLVGTIDTPNMPIQYLEFNKMAEHLGAAVGRFIELRFTLEDNTDVTARGNPPKLYAYEVHAQAFFRPVRVWMFHAAVGEKVMLKTGVLHEMTPEEMKREFDALERQSFPPTMMWEGEPTLVRVVGFERYLPAGSVEAPTALTETPHEVWRVTLREAYPR